VSNKNLEEGFEDIIAELDREQARVRVRRETRRFGKPTTIIEGLRINERDLQELGTKMKKSLATGGSVKNGVIILQGDHRERVSQILMEQGYSQSSIEII
jgi:translation initiation factor 1